MRAGREAALNLPYLPRSRSSRGRPRSVVPLRSRHMTMEERTAVVGVFEHREDADRAVEALRHDGFPDDRIGFAVRGGGDPPEGAADATTAGAGESAAT